jgi:hypothetical protein
MQQHWEWTQLPQLERKSYKLWRQGQNPTQIQTWQGDAEHWRGQVAKLVHEVAVMHVGKARLPARAIKKSSRSIQQMYVNLQEVVFKLKVSEMLQEPARPSQKRPAPARCVASCLGCAFVAMEIACTTMRQKPVHDKTCDRVLRLQSHDCIALLTNVHLAASRLVKTENLYLLVVCCMWSL